MRDIRFRSSIPFLVSKLFRHLARVHRRAVSKFEISAVQANILSVLWYEGDMTMGELQSFLALGSSTVTGAIDRMEKAGLVRRVASPDDRRVLRIEPVSWPKKRRDALISELLATEVEAFSLLSESERIELARLLEKAMTSIERLDSVHEP